MPPRKIILHVGMHKTGTTSIQRAFDGYDDGRIAYADLKIRRNRTPNHGVALETIFRDEIEKIPFHRMHGRSPRTILRFRERFAKRLDTQLALDRETLIFSGEAIPRLNPDELRALRDKLQSTDARVTVVAYLRDPVGFSSSMYQQSLKTGAAIDPRYIPRPGYTQKFLKFQTVFGAESLRFVKFDPFRFPEKSVVKHFAEMIGVSDVKDTETANTSLSADAVRCLYILAKEPDLDLSNQTNRAAFRRVANILAADMPGTSFRLPEAAVAAAVPRADIAWINQVSGVGFEAPEGKMSSEELDENMSSLSEAGHERLHEILRARGLAIERDAASTMLAALYQSTFSTAQWSVLRTRLKDSVATWFAR